MSRYFFYDNPYIPSLYEKTVPQVFPTTAPGNFTWLPEIGHYVMTTFYPYQWDLNYGNPRVFNEMMYNFLFLANKGIDVIRIDAVPYIWKELNTPCRNLPQVHTIVRMMRLISEIVCPGVILLGGIEERSHKKYLNDYFQGFAGESNSRGVLYNEDPVTGDARFCGTTASMCGIEKAGFEKNKAAMEKAIQLDVMLHAYMFMQSGIPVIYSGDEIGQVNDYSYKNDPDKAPDSRYIHRGAMNWDRAAMSGNARTVEGKLNKRLLQLEKIRKTEKAFMTNADTWTVDTWDNSILCIGRYYEGEKIYGLFNFSEYDKTAWINERDGIYKDLITGQEMEAAGVNVPAYGFFWLKKIN